MASSTNPQFQTTEWEDLQVKHGNFEERLKPVTGEELTNIAVDFAEQIDPLANKSLKELNELEDVIEEDTLESLRAKRLQELKQAREDYKFGDVEELRQHEYVSKVTEASENYWVVLHLYQSYNERCKIVDEQFSKLAKKYGGVRFYRGVANNIVPNFPDRSLPTLLFYTKGFCVNQISGDNVLVAGDPAPYERIANLLVKNGVVAQDKDKDEDEHEGRSTKTTTHAEDIGRIASMNNDDREYMSLNMPRRIE